MVRTPTITAMLGLNGDPFVLNESWGGGASGVGEFPLLSPSS